MRLWTWLILIVECTLVIVVAIAVGAGLMPLGVPGEWEWLRVDVPPPFDGMALALLAVGLYAGFVALGLKLIAARSSRRTEVAWLIGLWVAALGVQVVVPMGAAEGYDLSKWAAVNYLPGSAGYFKVARQQAMRDPWKFLAEYPEWIKGQDSLHIGTHPPGLIALQCFMIGVMDRNPGLTGLLLEHMPSNVDMGFRIFGAKDPQPLSRADRAALYATVP